MPNIPTRLESALLVKQADHLIAKIEAAMACMFQRYDVDWQQRSSEDFNKRFEKLFALSQRANVRALRRLRSHRSRITFKGDTDLV